MTNSSPPVDSPAESDGPSAPGRLQLVGGASQLKEISRPSRWVWRAFLLMRGLPKTIYFNLRCLPFRQAIRLPVLVSPKVALYDTRGKVTIEGPVRTAMILIGFGELGAFDFKRSRAVWQVAGRVIFDGPSRLSNGFKLSVAPTGTVRFGTGNIGIPESQVMCRDRITFGKNSGVGWDVLITDTDFHPLLPPDGEPTPAEAPVEIGEYSWVGARSIIVKGVRLPRDTVVAAGSVVTRSVDEPNTLIGGNPAKTIRTGVAGYRRLEESSEVPAP